MDEREAEFKALVDRGDLLDALHLALRMMPDCMRKVADAADAIVDGVKTPAAPGYAPRTLAVIEFAMPGYVAAYRAFFRTEDLLAMLCGADRPPITLMSVEQIDQAARIVATGYPNEAVAGVEESARLTVLAATTFQRVGEFAAAYKLLMVDPNSEKMFANHVLVEPLAFFASALGRLFLTRRLLRGY